jgi:hypothetical protein
MIFGILILNTLSLPPFLRPLNQLAIGYWPLAVGQNPTAYG